MIQYSKKHAKCKLRHQMQHNKFHFGCNDFLYHRILQMVKMQDCKKLQEMGLWLQDVFQVNCSVGCSLGCLCSLRRATRFHCPALSVQCQSAPDTATQTWGGDGRGVGVLYCLTNVVSVPSVEVHPISSLACGTSCLHLVAILVSSTNPNILNWVVCIYSESG